MSDAPKTAPITTTQPVAAPASAPSQGVAKPADAKPADVKAGDAPKTS